MKTHVHIPDISRQVIVSDITVAFVTSVAAPDALLDAGYTNQQLGGTITAARAEQNWRIPVTCVAPAAQWARNSLKRSRQLIQVLDSDGLEWLCRHGPINQHLINAINNTDATISTATVEALPARYRTKIAGADKTVGLGEPAPTPRLVVSPAKAVAAPVWDTQERSIPALINIIETRFQAEQTSPREAWRTLLALVSNWQSSWMDLIDTVCATT